ncbi:MAG: dTDP-4-dehydrorhamnose 3,5-epimerase [Myxococcota bacterium]
MQVIEKTDFEGIYKIRHKRFKDDRGLFLEVFRTQELKEFGFNGVLQQNLSISNKGVIRGLHLQMSPYEQSKIITVLSGAIYDIILDLRRDSKTYLKCLKINLDMDSEYSILITKGFAHGFQALEDETTLLYSVDNIYSPEFERGINIFSKEINIKFPIEDKIISEKDEGLPELTEFLEIYEKK